MATTNEGLTYKGRPLMRKDNLIYYGSMADSHIVLLQVLESREEKGVQLATRVSVQLQLTDPELKSFVGQMMTKHQELFAQFYQLV